MPIERNALRTKSTAALWNVCASPAAATSRQAPGHQNPAWINRYMRVKYRFTKRRLSLMPSSARPRQLAIGRVEDVRHDEQREAAEVDPAVAVREQVAGDEPRHQRPQRHLIGGDPGRLQRARDPDADRSEEVEVHPLLDRTPLMGQVGR